MAAGAGDDAMTTDDGLTARERRAIRVKQQARADAPKKAGKTIAVALVVVLVIAGGVWGYQQIPKGRGSGHEHSVYRMFVDGQEISFEHPAYDMQQTGFSNMHVHTGGTGGKYVLHMEGKLGVSLARFLESLQIKASDTKVTLNPTYDGGRVVQNNATHSWQLWVDDCRDGVEGNFAREPRIFGYAPLHHDRMLITYARSDATNESLASETALLPSFADIDRELRETCTPN